MTNTETMKIPNYPGWFWITQDGSMTIVKVHRAMSGTLYVLYAGDPNFYALDKVEGDWISEIQHGIHGLPAKRVCKINPSDFDGEQKAYLNSTKADNL